MERTVYPPLLPNHPSLLYGGDYNPEQWPSDIWPEDDRLMGLAHWNAVTLGVFSWVTYEREEGVFKFDWLDRLFDIEATAGRKVMLATPSAAAPAWLSQKYPETLRTGSDGVRRRHGNRVNYCWSSPVYREKCRVIDRRLAERYKNHPALGCWHISNELGGECFCQSCQAAFRNWLQKKYGSLEALNSAYWTTFWSHTYTDWSQIEAPGDPYRETALPGLTVDWRRFTSDQIVDFYLNEANVVREITPAIPVTTNLMGTYPVLNPFAIAPHMDFASWDSYPFFGGCQTDVVSWMDASFTHDLNRSLKGGQPFLLMECAPSASNWYPVMNLKRPNVNVLEGLQAVAHGADGVQYFQWRQGRGSMEQYHGAVMTHNNRSDTKVFQDVASLGETLKQLDGVAGSAVDAKVAVIYDWENAWGFETATNHRSKRGMYGRTVCSHYAPFWKAGIETDVIDSTMPFDRYKLIVAPMLYMLRPGVAERLSKFVEQGGALVMTYWSGWVDENCLTFWGGYPEPLRSVLGIWSEEMDELYADQHNEVATLASDLFQSDQRFTASDYCERIHVETAEVLATYGAHFYAGDPAVTRNRYGKGQAIYVASRNEESFLSELLVNLAAQVGVAPCVKGEWSSGVCVRRRRAEATDYVFILNFEDKEATVDFDEEGLKDPRSGAEVRKLKLGPYGSAVLVNSTVKAYVEVSS